MSGRRGTKRGQKAAELPTDILLEERDVGPNLRIDQRLIATTSADPLYAQPPAGEPGLDNAAAAELGPGLHGKLGRWVWSARRHAASCMLLVLLGLCLSLTLQTQRLAAAVTQQQTLLSQWQHDLGSEQRMRKHSGLNSIAKSMERADKRLARLEASNTTSTCSTSPPTAADLQLLQDALTNETRAQCATCQSSCTAQAVQQLQAMHVPLLQNLQAAVSHIRAAQLDTSDLIPAAVVRHSALAPRQSAISILDRLKSAFLHLSLHPVHPQASAYLQQIVPLPTRCLPLHGSCGFIDLQLPSNSLVTALSIQHPWNRTRSPTTAPQQVSLYRLVPSSWPSGWTEDRLGSWTYLVPGSELQVFQLQQPTVMSMVRLKLESNHGSAKYTCLYSLHFHGTLDQAAEQ